MTGPGAPSSPGQEHAPGTAADPAGTGGPAADGAPPTSPAMVRAAKLNAANMVRSLLPLVVICVALVAWASFRQSPVDPSVEVDPGSAVRVSAERADYEVLAPSGLPDGYRPTSARTTAGGAGEGEPVTLEIGFLTPAEEFAGFVISDDPEAAPLRVVLDGAEEQGQLSIGGESGTRATTTPAEGALTPEAGQATVLVSGSAGGDELTEGAASPAPAPG